MNAKQARIQFEENKGLREAENLRTKESRIRLSINQIQGLISEMVSSATYEKLWVSGHLPEVYDHFRAEGYEVTTEPTTDSRVGSVEEKDRKVIISLPKAVIEELVPKD